MGKLPWVKLHSSSLQNDVFRFDHTAWRIFTTLLMASNDKGVWKGGREMLGNLACVTPVTAYKASKRLEKAGMIRILSNSRFSEYHICNWNTYQSREYQPSNSRVTAEEHSSKNKKKDKEIYTSSSNELRQLHETICELFGKSPERYKLLPKRRTTLKTRLADTGFDNIVKACTALSNSAFHMGDNDRGWVADPYWCLSSAEKAEEWSTKETDKKGYTGKLTELEIEL